MMNNSDLKICIWCRRSQHENTFAKKAHTIPQSLGGTHICDNICDNCNEFFGQHYQGSPSVEAIFKEAFQISRARLLDEDAHVGKNKTITRIKSTYFNVDIKKHKVDLKPAFKLRAGFQEKIGRLLKRGLYKVFLEETERQKSEGLDEKYDFIREFARYDLGDFPVFYYERSLKAILTIKKWIVNPVLLLNPDEQFNYLVREPNFFEFEFLGHVFGIATSRYWQLTIDDYIAKSSKAKEPFFKTIRVVSNFSDVDFALDILND